jgi:hypothetical protein
LIAPFSVRSFSGLHRAHFPPKINYLKSGDYRNYLAELKRDALLVHDRGALDIVAVAEKGFAARGGPGMLAAMLQVQKKLYAQHALPPTELAKTYGLMRDKTEALNYLKAAYELRDSELLFVQIYSELDLVHGEPEYRDLLGKMNLPVSN